MLGYKLEGVELNRLPFADDLTVLVKDVRSATTQSTEGNVRENSVENRPIIQKY